jgi:uncharacterized protein YbjT (DUF2867 family)
MTMKIAVAGGTGTVGRYVVDAIRAHGHEALVLSRSTGVDLVRPGGVAEALAGVDAVIDVTSVQTQSAATSVAFFETVTRNLLAAETAAGVAHHVALGIIGSDISPLGYYAGKVRQERLVEGSSVPWTILRASQFHEFAGQIYGVARVGPVVLVPAMLSQPIAAREVAARLVDLALADPGGRVAELAGPRVERMARMTRRWARATHHPGPVVQVPLPGGAGRAMRNGSLLPGPRAQLGVQTFDDWLAAAGAERQVP